MPTLAKIAADPATGWSEATVQRYGNAETVMLHQIDGLWGPLGAETPVRVIPIQDPARTSGYQIALITTDLHNTPAQIIQRYADRWPIEVAYEDAKHLFGVGHARNRTRQAVQRIVPFQFLAMTVTIIWYTLHGHHPDVVAEHRARAPLVPVQGQPIDRRHAHQAAPHDHRHPISPRKDRTALTRPNHPGPARLGRRRHLKRESRACFRHAV